MKNTLLFIIISALYFSASPGPLSCLLSPAPARKMDSVEIVMKLNIPVGIIGLMKSSEPGRQLDAKILNCVGFGPSLQWQQWTGRNYSLFAVTAAVLLFPQVDADAFPWDVGAGVLVTGFDGYGLGVAYNAGKVEGKTVNRIIGMLVADVIPWKNK